MSKNHSVEFHSILFITKVQFNAIKCCLSLTRDIIYKIVKQYMIQKQL